MSETTSNLTYYYTFDGLTGSSGLKAACMAFSAVFIPIDLLLMYSIIWYELFGTDAKQTIINKFLSSACWTCFYSIFTVQVNYSYSQEAEDFFAQVWAYKACFPQAAQLGTYFKLSIIHREAHS